MGIFSHLRKAQHSAKISSMVKARMTNFDKLKKRITLLYEDVQITPTQKSEIDRLRLEYSTKSRQMLEVYMAKEIDVLEDLKGKYQYTVDKYKK